MTDHQQEILTRVDTILTGKELLDQPRAYLLLRMSQLTLPFNPELSQIYWQMLQSVLNKLPAETQADVNELRLTLEESLPSGAKGFSAELLGEIQEINKLPGIDEKKDRLRDCESRLKKKFMLTGKGVVWTALMDAWLPLDRHYAIELMKNVSGGQQENTLMKWNKASSFSEEEWALLVDSIGMGKIERAIIKMLDDEKQFVVLPNKVLSQVAEKMRNSMQQFANPVNQGEIVKAYNKYVRLLSLHASGSQAAMIPTLMEELYLFIAKAVWLEQSWMIRFYLIEALIGVGLSLKTSGIDLFTPEYLQNLIAKTPPYLANFFWAAWAGSSCTEENARQNHANLMEKTGNDTTAEAWFLVTLVKRGLGELAFSLAESSPNQQMLLPHLRRCWICTHPETAKTRISPADMASDPIGEFLVQGSTAERAAYLKSVTQDGSKSVPGAMWAGAGTEDELEGVRGFWKNLTAHRKTNDEIVQEYLALNPVYSSYRIDTKKEQQFSEALRVNGFGEYNYKDTDSAMLQALVSWGDQEPEKVRTVLQTMWHAIRPDDPILMVDWLRNAMFTRFIHMFSADPQILIDAYLNWHDQEMVKKGRQWQFGKQIITLRYPPTSLLQFSVMAASEVSPVSPPRRDRILVNGLEKFEGEPAVVELAAQLYNSDKAPLSLEPPVTLKPNVKPSWQMGIIKNALPLILQEQVASFNASQ